MSLNASEDIFIKSIHKDSEMMIVRRQIKSIVGALIINAFGQLCYC